MPNFSTRKKIKCNFTTKHNDWDLKHKGDNTTGSREKLYSNKSNQQS